MLAMVALAVPWKSLCGGEHWFSGADNHNELETDNEFTYDKDTLKWT